MVVPLVAIANPAQYVTHPLRVFELDFEANLDIVRHCVKYNKRLIFPSTSEIYGMSPDPVLDEETSPLMYGPINKQRWIYAASKQLLDRVIYAYGVRDNLDYTLFRPFNFIGPNLDNVEEPKEGSSRVFTQFLSNVLYQRPIKLVDGGSQKRSFTFIDDAIEALLTILENKDARASRRIFNIGNPGQLHLDPRSRRSAPSASRRSSPVLRENAKATEIVDVTAGEYYGKYYQDIQVRVPDIEAAKRDLGWAPKHRHGHRHPAHHRLLREAGRLRAARGGPGEDLAARVLPQLMEHRRGAPAALRGLGWLAWLVLAAAWFATCRCARCSTRTKVGTPRSRGRWSSSGDWITPRFDGLKYFEKPPLQYWATAAAYAVFGVQRWTSRLWTRGTGIRLPADGVWLDAALVRPQRALAALLTALA